MHKSTKRIHAGDRVVLRILPPWVHHLPDESRTVFEFCVGRAFTVSEIDRNGHLVLDVSADVDNRFGGYLNDLRVESQYVVLAEDNCLT